MVKCNQDSKRCRKLVSEKDKGETKKTKQNKREKKKGDGSYSERVRAKLFCCAFKISFLQ